MSRPLDELGADRSDTVEVDRDPGVTRRTGRSFAAAVSFLVLSTLVVNRSDAAFSSQSALAASAVDSGTVRLSDDDEGHSLFVLEDLSPARPALRCIEITYGGTILPVALDVQARANGALTEFLDVTIDEGAGGGYGSCDGFVASDTVFEGSLDEMTELGWIGIGTLLNSGDRRTFRISLRLEDREAALGQTTTLEFAWEVTPS